MSSRVDPCPLTDRIRKFADGALTVVTAFAVLLLLLVFAATFALLVYAAYAGIGLWAASLVLFAVLMMGGLLMHLTSA